MTGPKTGGRSLHLSHSVVHNRERRSGTKPHSFDPPKKPHCGVEVWRGGLGGTYRLPALSFAGASLASPCFRFHTPLIEPDVRICRIRLSEKTHAIAVAITCDAVCNF
jgi:hypothetical protein